jgi:hypothetical protein
MRRHDPPATETVRKLRNPSPWGRSCEEIEIAHRHLLRLQEFASWEGGHYIAFLNDLGFTPARRRNEVVK